MHKLSILFLLLTLVNLSLLAQSNWGKRQNHSIDLILGGDVGFRIIQNTSNTPELLQQFENRTSLERYKVNHRIGFNYVHGLSEDFALKTGLRMTNPGMSVGVKVEEYDLNQDINTLEKKINLSEGYEFRYNYQMIEMPLGIRYVLSKSFCEPYFETGISTYYYAHTLVQKRTNNNILETTKIQENIKQFSFIGYFSMGGNFVISRDFSGFTQLIGRYQLNNLRASNLSEKLVSLGMELGVRYHL